MMFNDLKEGDHFTFRYDTTQTLYKKGEDNKYTYDEILNVFQGIPQNEVILVKDGDYQPPVETAPRISLLKDRPCEVGWWWVFKVDHQARTTNLNVIHIGKDAIDGDTSDCSSPAETIKYIKAEIPPDLICYFVNNIVNK